MTQLRRNASSAALCEGHAKLGSADKASRGLSTNDEARTTSGNNDCPSQKQEIDLIMRSRKIILHKKHPGRLIIW